MKTMAIQKDWSMMPPLPINETAIGVAFPDRIYMNSVGGSGSRKHETALGVAFLERFYMNSVGGAGSGKHEAAIGVTVLAGF